MRVGKRDNKILLGGSQLKRQINISRIKRDPAYPRLVPVDANAFESERRKSWIFDATSGHHDCWVELEMKPSGESKLVPDIWEVVPGVFAMEQNAAYELCSSTEETQDGYMHNLLCEGRKLAVINSTHCVDCLEVGKSHFDSADPSKIVEYSFDGAQLAISLFKIPQTRSTELLSLDGFDDENDFKTLVEKFGFTGVKFERLWEGDSFMDA